MLVKPNKFSASSKDMLPVALGHVNKITHNNCTVKGSCAVCQQVSSGLTSLIRLKGGLYCVDLPFGSELLLFVTV